MVSAIVRMVPLPAERLRPVSARAFETVVARAFSQRRKMLRRVLADWAPPVSYTHLDVYKRQTLTWRSSSWSSRRSRGVKTP